LIVERRKEQRVIARGAHVDYVEARFVCVSGLTGKRLLVGGAQVRVKMKVDDVRWLLAAIDPPNSFRARVGEMVEVDLEVDLVAVALNRLQRLLRSRCWPTDKNQERQKEEC